jgi:phage shock protein C
MGSRDDLRDDDGRNDDGRDERSPEEGRGKRRRGCGHRPRRAPSAGARPSRQRLYRNTEDAWIAGVCAGIADYFGLGAGLVRFLSVLALFFFPPPTLFGYLLMALVLKRQPEQLYANAEEETFWRKVRLEPSRTAHDLARKFQDLERRLRAAEAKVTSSEFKLRRQFRDLETGGEPPRA